MRLSIIYVNYNVKFYLEQSIISVRKACQDIAYEIIVVDNASIDGSQSYLTSRYPELRWIQNERNVGFGKANNQALAGARGDYVFILNPDTIVEEKSIVQAIGYMDSHEDTGAMGFRLLDGSGEYLPESKRGLPTSWRSFCKITGLYKLAKGSEFLNGYYMGHLSDEQIAQVEVLSGACIFVRRSVLEAIGGFDERYFMYAEDIDLSYQITKVGYKLMYFPTASLVHYKGESTKKSSMAYYKVFYQSMWLFVDKYKGELYSSVEHFVFKLIIGSIGVLHFITKKLKGFFRLLIPWSISAVSILAFAKLWANYYHGNPSYYEHKPFWYFAVVYSLCWSMCFLFFRWYRRRSFLGALNYGTLYSTVLALVVYGLLPEEWRVSRMLVTAGSVASYALFLVLTLAFFELRGLPFSRLFKNREKAILIADKSYKELVFASGLYQNYHWVGYISIDDKGAVEDYHIGGVDDFQSLVRMYRPDVLAFSLAALDFDEVLRLMKLTNGNVKSLLLPGGTSSVLSSPDKNRQGDVVELDFQVAINKKESRVGKRILDVALSILFMALWPLYFWAFTHPVRLLKNLMLILRGEKTFVNGDWSESNYTIDDRRPGLIKLSRQNKGERKPRITSRYYAENYSTLLDLQIIFSNLKMLSNNVL